MQRTAGIAALARRAAAANSAAQYANSPFHFSHHRLPQAASFTVLSSSGAESLLQGRLFEHLSSQPTQCRRHGVAGTVFFSVAASSTMQEAYAKEPVASSSAFRPNDVVLYQYEACPFCNKVKAFLDYYDVPYKVVEVNPINKKEIKWSDYKKVPILKVDEEQMVNSSDIINNLYRRLHPDGSADSGNGTEEEREWLGWVDNHLVHVLSPNIYRSVGEALESFDYITTHGNFSFMERIIAKYSGAAAMYFVSKKLKKKHNITDERGALYQSAETWVDALKGRDFLGGKRPNLADLAVFGVLRPIRNLQSGKDMVEHTRITEWYSRMERAVGKPSRINA